LRAKPIEHAQDDDAEQEPTQPARNLSQAIP
jgi:hypothetical protein